MRRLTPELWLHSAFHGGSPLVVTRELDFNLARRSAVVVNRIVGQMNITPTTTTGFDILRSAYQEVDADPDNVDIEFAGSLVANAVVIDSSRMYRQVFPQAAWDTAAGAVSNPHTLLVKDWSCVPLNERPISITNLRHHVVVDATINNTFHGEVNIDYFIVELSLEEIGILNSSRR